MLHCKERAGYLSRPHPVNAPPGSLCARRVAMCAPFFSSLVLSKFEPAATKTILIAAERRTARLVKD
jgi:hypothetical protein